MTVLILVAGVASALVGGVLFAFSVFVMRALADLPPDQGVRAMQRINVRVLHPAFMGVFLGTAPLLGAAAFLARETPGAFSLLLAAFFLYGVGCIGVTVTWHVPRNNRLASLEASTPEAATHWPGFVRAWVALNHLRCAAAVGAAVLALLALGRGGPG